MSANWKENFLFDSPNRPNVSHLTVWEADVEEAESDGTGAVRRSIRFVSENSDLSPEVFEFASKAIDLKARGEKFMKMALETVPIGSSNVGSETHRRIVGLRALFDADTLPFMQRSEGKESEPGDPTFPADHYVDPEKWAKLAEGGTYRSSAPRPSEDQAAFTQGAFAELFKNAAHRALINLRAEDEDRDLSHYRVAFFGGMRTSSKMGDVPAERSDENNPVLEVTYCQSNADPVEATCTLRVPMSEAQNIMAEALVSAHQADDTFGPKTIDELTDYLVRTCGLPKEILQASSAVEHIVREWAQSPECRVQESDEPTTFFPTPTKM